MTLKNYQQNLLKRLLAPPSDHPSEQRLNIYRQNITASRLQALAHVFPCCQRLLGEDYFAQLANHFISDHPSTTAQPDACAEAFIEYMQHFADIVEQVPYIVDVARLDLAWQQVFHGPNNAAVDYAHLQHAAEQQGEALRLQRTAGMQLLSSTFPLHEIWQMCQPEYGGEFAVDSGQKNFRFAVLQREHAVHILPLLPLEYDILQAVAAPIGLDDLCQSVSFPPELLADLYQRGWLQMAS